MSAKRKPSPPRTNMLVREAGATMQLQYIWHNMNGRCNHPGHPKYADYGGRGITVDPRWNRQFNKQAFKNFYEDMGNRPQGMSLDRIDNDAGYSPSNCRWATKIDQNYNRRKIARLPHFTIAEIAQHIKTLPREAQEELIRILQGVVQ